MRDFALGVSSILVAVIVLAIGGEIAIRLLHLFSEYVGPPKVTGVITLDKELGWLPIPNYSFSGELVDADGKPYAVDIQTDSAGYRTFGNPQTYSSKKVLFLGDSFTQAMHVSNDQTYFEILGRELDIEVFAFGVEAYGTLQEYMMLDKIIGDIRPDVVVLQFCPNDFINNHYELELRSIQNNNGLHRPYFWENEITYRTPARLVTLRNFANNYSQFLYFILSRIDKVNAVSASSSAAETSENLITKGGMSYPFFRESTQVTEQLITKFRQRVPVVTPVYIFSSHHPVPYYEQIKKISERSGTIFIDGPSQAISAAQDAGTTTLAADNAHWNNAGHQIVADVLKRYFLASGQLERRDDSNAVP